MIDINKIKTYIDKNYIIYIITFIQWYLTFFTDSKIFIENIADNLFLYFTLKIILFIVLFNWWKFIIQDNKKNKQVFVYAIPYFLILLTYFFINHQMFLKGDELNIFNCVIRFNISPYHFTYFTGLMYAISLMIMPFPIGIVIIKIIIQSLICGYCVYKCKNYYKSNWSYLIYFLFLIPNVIENGILIHRMQYYGLLYLVIIVKLVFDYKSNKKIEIIKMLLLMLALAVLTIWRKEGIYLLAFAPLIICAVYNIKTLKKIVLTFTLFLLIVLAVEVPQLVSNKSFTLEDTHTYNQWFVNMCRNGLDKEKYPEQMEAIDKYVSIEAVDYINKKLGDENYEHEYIAWRNGYIGIRKEYTQENINNYKVAVRYLIIHEPIIFIKTRIGLWIYMSQMNNNIVFNINIPMIALIVLFVYSFIKRKNAYVLITMGLLLHTIITIIFAPAAYFKYYYHSYLIGEFFIIIALIQVCMKLESKLEKANNLAK